MPAGVVGVEGNWERMQAIRLVVRRRIAKNVPHSSGLEDGEPLSGSTVIARSLGQYLLRNDMEAAASSTSTSTSGTKTPPVIDSLRKDAPTLSSPSPLGNAAGEQGVPVATEPVTVEGKTDETGPGEDWEWQLIEVGRALANYTSIESERIKGLKSSQITSCWDTRIRIT